MTNFEKLKHFMEPYYQLSADEALLNTYLTDYTYPECAAAVLWAELKGKVGFRSKGTLQIDTGAEKFKYPSPNTLIEACNVNAKYYQDRCDTILGKGSCAVRIEKAYVAGISPLMGKIDA